MVAAICRWTRFIVVWISFHSTKIPRTWLLHSSILLRRSWISSRWTLSCKRIYPPRSQNEIVCYRTPPPARPRPMQIGALHINDAMQRTYSVDCWAKSGRLEQGWKHVRKNWLTMLCRCFADLFNNIKFLKTQHWATLHLKRAEPTRMRRGLNQAFGAGLIGHWSKSKRWMRRKVA